MVTLILGGARSGKSRYAERCASASGHDVVYIATATAADGEMARRIEHHRTHRPEHWRTVEEPLALARTLMAEAAAGRCLLVDCLTLWLNNLLYDQHGALQEARFRAEREALLDTLPRLPGATVLVGNEVGQGVIPDNPAARRFVDEAGWLHQAIAERAEQVVWICAGLPHRLKPAVGQ